MMHLPQRVVMFILGIFLMTLGIALSCKAGLGTTPISSVPYVMSMYTGYTIGELTIAMNFIFIAAQPLLLHAFHWKKLIGQAVALFMFGPEIDICMNFLSPFTPQNYYEMWAICILSAFILAMGVFLSIKANIFTAAGEGLVLAMEQVTKINFAFLKNCFDVGLVTISLMISFDVFGEMRGVGAGTIAAAVLVGRIVRVYEKNLNFCK